MNKEANGYRVPTNDEWIYAARAGTNYIHSGSNNIDDIGWYNGNSGAKIHNVGTKKGNAYELYDMTGNVHEYVWFPEANSAVGRGGSILTGSADFEVPEYLGSWDHLFWASPYRAATDFGIRIVRNAD